MTRIPLYQIDAFAEEVFQGNPAAVCLLSGWLPDETLRAIAAENNLSETAFLVLEESGGLYPEREQVPIRWFTPTEEVPLCGHGTLAAGFVVLDILYPDWEAVTFSSESGPLRVSREVEGFSLDLPALPVKHVQTPPDLLRKGLDVEPVEVWVTEADPNYLAIVESEQAVLSLEPDLRVLERLHPYGVAVSAPGESADFVSRYFAPGYGIPEDPVTGSIHCALGPHWARRLGRSTLSALQLSGRRGQLNVGVKGDRVHLAGGAALYLTGEAQLP